MDTLSEKTGNEDGVEEVDTRSEPEEPKQRGSMGTITMAKAGMAFGRVATACNGWNAVAINGQAGGDREIRCYH